MSREYIFPINITSAFTAQIDIFEFLTVTEKPCKLMAFELGQISEIGDAQEEVLTMVLKRVTGAPTSGSGGSTAAAGTAITPNDTAGSATIEAGNTTKLTGGTSVDISRHDWYIRGNYLWQPIPEMMPIIAGATRAVLELVTTPADSISGIHGWLAYSELV